MPRNQRRSSGLSDMELSKELVRVLRHGKYDLAMDCNGFVDVIEIIEAFSRSGFAQISCDNIKRIVETDRKGRYELKMDRSQWKVRATQGHTVQVENPDLQLLTDAGKYENIIHGTKMSHWNSIALAGLHRMNRTHIHFCIGLPGDSQVISGMPPRCDVAIYLNVPKAMRG
uniref:2'-phosphotransferase n=1 Tax=Phallusia mammillata TaxID=59560 RepID=A0A6F9DWD3_9ASCI|nr:tRNA 2'-phosphotransferase 1-like [Phallusia mammillata]